MTFLIYITILIFHYLHPHDYYRLTSEKFWTRPVFLWPHGNIFLLLWVWEAGQEQPSANRTAFGMRGWRKWLYMYLWNLTVSFFRSLFCFQLLYLHGSKLFLDQPSRMWVILFSSGGQAAVIAGDLCLSIAWDKGWILKRTWLLVTKECIHSYQEWADKPAEILGTKVFYCPSESF